jgi:hypothetical protein
MIQKQLREKGIIAAAGSAFFLGFNAYLWQAIHLLGFTPFAVVAIRTSLATLLLSLSLCFQAVSFYIYPLGLIVVLQQVL